METSVVPALSSPSRLPPYGNAIRPVPEPLLEVAVGPHHCASVQIIAIEVISLTGPPTQILFMKQSISLNAKLRWPDVRDHYVVVYEGHAIGTIHRSGDSWSWSISVPMGLPDWSIGNASSLHEGIKALGNAWAGILKSTSAERLQRAWDLERAAEARNTGFEANTNT